MDPREILIRLKMLEEGLIPARCGVELVDMLKKLDDDERRKVTRKFRKIWRKMAKKDPSIKEKLGLGKNKPTKTQRTERSVRSYIDAGKKI
jgi:hypothetical protein